MLTNFLIENLIKRVYNGTPYALSDTVYLGLLAKVPVPVNPVGEEFTGAGYSRVLLTDKLSPVANNSITNLSRIEFPRSLEQWNGVEGLGIYSEETLGSLLDHHRFSSSVTIPENHVIFWDPGTFSLSWIRGENTLSPYGGNTFGFGVNSRTATMSSTSFSGGNFINSASKL